MTGNCHCGAVSVSLESKPEYINLCDCSLCAKSGGAWGYFTPEQVTVTGQTSGYRRSDYKEPAVEVRFCPQCGTTTHWITTEHFDEARLGVNMRIFDPLLVDGIEVRFLDGRNWFGETVPQHRRAPGIAGQDVFL